MKQKVKQEEWIKSLEPICGHLWSSDVVKSLMANYQVRQLITTCIEEYNAVMKENEEMYAANEIYSTHHTLDTSSVEDLKNYRAYIDKILGEKDKQAIKLKN